MKIISWSELIKTADITLRRRAPGVLTGLGVAGMISTTVIAVRATPRAIRLIEARKKETRQEKLTPVEMIKTAGACYIPAAVTGALSIACLVGASSVSARRNAALATAYQLSESALKTYKEKVIETIGEKKEQQVRDAVDKDTIDKNPVGTNEVIITGRGKMLCYDPVSGRYFESDMDTLLSAKNEINHILNTQDYASLNELYYLLGLSPIEVGNDRGFNVRKGLLEYQFSTQLTEDGRPCLVISYKAFPEYSYL